MLLKLPWLPATVQVFVQTASESTANGTAGYIEEHHERLWRLGAALFLYMFGLCGIFGLSGVAIGRCKHPAAQAMAWLSALIIGIGLPIFDGSRIDAVTDRFYVVSVVYLPIGIAILAATALLLSLFKSPVR